MKAHDTEFDGAELMAYKPMGMAASLTIHAPKEPPKEKPKVIIAVR